VPKKTRSVPSAGKIMASVFWDAEGIWFIILKRVNNNWGILFQSFNYTTRKQVVRKDLVCEKKSSFIRTLHPPTKVL
jgi:hypothetical protein